MAEALEDLPYEELRHRAFELAEKRHDIGFFYDLLTHTSSLEAVSDEGGSLGDISGSLVGLIAAAKEAFGRESVADLEPLFVARFATYLREHGEQ